jgi:hypothetical protein
MMRADASSLMEKQAVKHWNYHASASHFDPLPRRRITFLDIVAQYSAGVMITNYWDRKHETKLKLI